MGSGVLHGGGGQLHHGDLVPQACQPVSVIPYAASNVVDGGFLRQPAQQEFLGAGGFQLANAPLQPPDLRTLFVKVVSLPVDFHGFAPFGPIIPYRSVRGKKDGGTIKSLTPRQVADLLGHSTSQITELYYVKKDTSRLHGITDGFNL